jgi:ABC-type sugar transport system ATPase subunit
MMDEPFKNLSAAYRPLMNKLLKELSESLYFQFIIINHEKDYIEENDNIIEII